MQGGSGQRGRSEHPDSGRLEGVQTEPRGGGGELQGAERRHSALRLRLGGLELPGHPENLEVQRFKLKPNSDLVPVAETRSQAKTHFYFSFTHVCQTAAGQLCNFWVTLGQNLVKISKTLDLFLIIRRPFWFLSRLRKIDFKCISCIFK